MCKGAGWLSFTFIRKAVSVKSMILRRRRKQIRRIVHGHSPRSVHWPGHNQIGHWLPTSRQSHLVESRRGFNWPITKKKKNLGGGGLRVNQALWEEFWIFNCSSVYVIQLKTKYLYDFLYWIGKIPPRIRAPSDNMAPRKIRNLTAQL